MLAVAKGLGVLKGLVVNKPGVMELWGEGASETRLNLALVDEQGSRKVGTLGTCSQPI